MKKSVCVILVLALFALTTLSACGEAKIIEGKNYDTYGVINKDDVADPAIEYKPIWGNIIWGCLLIETIIGPIYFFGFSMFEPVGVKHVAPQNSNVEPSSFTQ